MNSSIQRKLNEIRQKTRTDKISGLKVIVRKNAKPDGLSMAIHSQKDADQFIAELAALRKRRKAK